jgi:hypothetical protein
LAQVIEITLTEEQRQELEAIVARPSEGAGLVRRARVILLSARGVSGREIALRLDLSAGDQASREGSGVLHVS